MASYRNGNNGNGDYHAPAVRRGVRPQQFRVPPHVLRAAGTPRTSRSRVGLFVLLALLIGLALIPVAGAGASGAYYAQTAAQLRPRLDKLRQYKAFQTSRMYDRYGNLLYEFVSNGRRDPVKLDQISPLLIDATISIEDKNFWTNPGIDPEGIAKTLYRSFQQGAETGGASTITQQVIKNIVLTDEEKSYANRYQRKVKEIVLAQQLNDEYSKQEILELYLNEINYGNLAYGIQAAAQRYFGKNAKDLNLNEASLLAGIPQLPSRWNPLLYTTDGNVLKGVKLRKDSWLDLNKPLPNGITPTRARQVDVLRQMVENKKVTEQQAREAIAQDVTFANPDKQAVNPAAPHFIYYVKQLIESDPEIGPLLSKEGGLTITTTIDLDIQAVAQREAKKRIEELQADKRNINNAGLVVEQPGTGQILAMVGSVDFNAIKKTETPGEEGNVLDGQVNVTTAERQPGSALKPFTYLSALNQGVLTPGSILWDVATEFPIRGGANDSNVKKCLPDPGAYWFCPKNFDQKWHGPLRMREGLANSLNMPAVLALKRAGIGPTRDLLHKMGISGLQREDSYYGLSMTLGGGEVTPLDLTTAYNTLANDGRYVQATPILKITDRDGKTLREFNAGPNEQVVNPALVAIVRDVMGDNEARTPLFGRNNPLKLSRPLYAKTGTTDDFRDAWALGYTPYVTVGVWTGNNNNEKTARVESTQGGGVILNRVMEAFFKDPKIDRFLRGPKLEKPLAFPSPEVYGAVKRPICQIGGAFGQRTSEWFTPEMLQNNKDSANCDLYRTMQVVKTADGGLCLPVAGQNYGAALVTMKVWNLPKSSEGEKIIDTSFNVGNNGDLQGTAPTEQCTDAVVLQPTTQPEPTPEGIQPGEPGQPGQPAAKRLPNLVGLGENQAKELLASLGVTNVAVDYQGADRLGDLFNQFPPYAVVSHTPGPGTPIEPGMTVILGVRAP